MIIISSYKCRSIYCPYIISLLYSGQVKVIKLQGPDIPKSIMQVNQIIRYQCLKKLIIAIQKFPLQIIRQMLQMKGSNFNSTIPRSLDRLKIFSKHQNIGDAIPAFSYTAHLLLNYAKSSDIKTVNQRYFSQFKKELETFTMRDFSKIKKHQKQIIDDILETVNTEIFIECLQPMLQGTTPIKLQHLNKDDYIKGFSHSDSSLSEQISQKKISTEEIHFNSTQCLYEIRDTNSQKKIQENIQSKSKHNLGRTESSEHSNPLNTAEQLYEQLVKSYKEHRIDQAYKHKNDYQKKFPTQISEDQKQLFETIQLEYTTMINFYKNFEEKDGWILDKIQKGVKLEYKINDEDKELAIKIESQFDVTIENFLVILSEMELFDEYVPFCYDSKQLKVVNRNQRIGSCKVYIPCLTDRQIYYYAAGYDRYNVNGSIFLYSKTIHEDKVYQEKYGFKVPEKSKFIRMQYKFFIIEYIPVTRETAKIRIASKVDLKLNYLPQFLVNMSARKFAFDYFKNIIKVNKKFKGSLWQKKAKENPDFYEFFRRKIGEYLGKKQS